jgi:hypothetical protein
VQKQIRHAQFVKVYSAQAKSKPFVPQFQKLGYINHHAVTGPEFPR